MKILNLFKSSKGDTQAVLDQVYKTYRQKEKEQLFIRMPFCLRFHQNTKARQTDFEGKSLADEREAYKGTASEETKIVNKISFFGRKPQVFNLK